MEQPVLHIRSDEPLVGSVDVDAIVRLVPRKYSVKGMFFSRFTAELGRGFDDLRSSLLAPPRLDRYLPFHDYPQADYLRLSVAVAQKRFRTFPLREAVRRIARDDLMIFADSMIGKVVLAMAGDARSTLLHVPEAYARVTNGGPVLATELDTRTVRVEFMEYHGLCDYQLGQLEGVVLHHGGIAEVTVHLHADDHVAFDVRHSR